MNTRKTKIYINIVSGMLSSILFKILDSLKKTKKNFVFLSESRVNLEFNCIITEWVVIFVMPYANCEFAVDD